MIKADRSLFIWDRLPATLGQMRGRITILLRSSYYTPSLVLSYKNNDLFKASIGDQPFIIQDCYSVLDAWSAPDTRAQRKGFWIRRCNDEGRMAPDAWVINFFSHKGLVMAASIETIAEKINRFLTLPLDTASHGIMPMDFPNKFEYTDRFIRANQVKNKIEYNNANEPFNTDDTVSIDPEPDDIWINAEEAHEDANQENIILEGGVSMQSNDNLSAPSALVAAKYEVVLQQDSDVHVECETNEDSLNIFVITQDEKKGRALVTFLTSHYGKEMLDRAVNVFVQNEQGIKYAPFNLDVDIAASTVCEMAFSGNTLFDRMETASSYYGYDVFAIIKPVILQYYADNINDPNGLLSFVAAELFDQIAGTKASVFNLHFCCDRVDA